MRCARNKGSARTRGVTLIELLIVMAIMLMVTAAAIPMMVPALQNRRMKEAARLVSSYVAGARSRAIETGRPVGVMIERFNGNNYAMSLSYVELPKPYAGDTEWARAVIGSTGVTNSSAIVGFATGDTGWMNTVRYGDLVRLNYGGPFYYLSSVTRAPLSDSGVDPLDGQPVMAPPSPASFGPGANPPPPMPTTPRPWYLLVRTNSTEPYTDSNGNGTYDYGESFLDANFNGVYDMGPPPESYNDYNSNSTYDGEPFVDQNGNGVKDTAGVYVATRQIPPSTQGVPFQIYRQPVRNSSPPLQLPEGAVIDLRASGVGVQNFFPTETVILGGAARQVVPFNPVIIFYPSGAVAYYIDSRGGIARPTGTMYLMLGRRELMEDVSNSGLDENIFVPTGPKPENRCLENFYITIGPQTGHVSTSEVANPSEQFTDSNNNGVWDMGEPYVDRNGNGSYDLNQVSLSRELAQQAQSAGGP